MNGVESVGPITEGHVRLDTLLLVRWLAIAGQTLTLVVVYFVFGFDLPLAPSLALIALVAWSNVFLRIRFSAERRLSERWTALTMGLDILQLAGLFYLTGGLQNPFILLIIAPVMVSASALSAQKTAGLGILVLLSVTVLALFHEPLPWYPGERLQMPLLFIGAVWIALVCSLVFMGTYAFRIAEEGRRFANALAATELVLAREQHLHALDGLAAAAAHELGTPLSTITLIVRELERTLDPATPIAADIRTLREQTQRCRDILAKLTQLSAAGAPFDRMRLSALVEEAVAPHRGFGIAIKIRQTTPGKSEPVTRRNPAVLYGLGNILENAVDFARETVEVDAWWDTRHVEIVIADDGPGIAPDILRKIGEPYLSRRPPDSGSGGLGLGIFIARTLLERSGAKVSFRNRTFPAHGAIVHVIWPRDAFEIEETQAEAAD